MTLEQAMKTNPGLVISFIHHLMFMVVSADDPDEAIRMLVLKPDILAQLSEDIFLEHVQEYH